MMMMQLPLPPDHDVDSSYLYSVWSSSNDFESKAVAATTLENFSPFLEKLLHEDREVEESIATKVMEDRVHMAKDIATGNDVEASASDNVKANDGDVFSTCK
jgi:hypothetical protein